MYENLFIAVTNSSDNTVGVYQVDTTAGTLTAVSGSPVTTGTFPFGVTFSPLINGNLFVAVTNQNGNSVSVFSVNTSTGVLTGVPGSPFSTGASSLPLSVAFSPLVNGNLFAAIAERGTDKVGVYTVNTSTGVLTQVSGSPFSTGTFPRYVVFSPFINGNLFAAVINKNDNTVSVYSVNTSTGFFTPVSGSPFGTGANPLGVAFSPLVNGNLFAAVPNSIDNTVSIYSVNTSTGFFNPISGSPFSTVASTFPEAVIFSPTLSGGLFVATANQSSSNVSVFQVNALIPTITTLSQYILSGGSVTLNGTITGGTQPYAITWQDSTVQSGIATTFSRIVSPTSTTIYDVATISDTNSCTAGPSNSITVGVRTCP